MRVAVSLRSTRGSQRGPSTAGSGALALALVVAVSRRGTLRLPSAPPPAETITPAVSASGRGFVGDDAG
ncbi:hypothetical protein [Micromonospora sp. NPDC005206]|uniref:hypothetical protein n=1 Tax=Micromonospora sp. NPDC005206 TaxID=3157022 RepID=UPI00339EDAD8